MGTNTSKIIVDHKDVDCKSNSDDIGQIKLTMNEYEDKIAEISNLTFELNKHKHIVIKNKLDYDQILIDLEDVKGYNGVLEENIKIIENENKEFKFKLNDIQSKFIGMNTDKENNPINSKNNSRERHIFNNQNLHINND